MGYLPKKSLTPKQQQILQHFADGDGIKQVARKMDIEVSSVHWHSNETYRKLGANHRAHAVVIALKEGLIQYGEEVEP